MFSFSSLLCLFPLNFHSKFEMYCMMIIMGGVVFPGFTQCCMMIIMGGVVFPGFTPQGQVHEVALP